MKKWTGIVFAGVFIFVLVGLSAHSEGSSLNDLIVKLESDFSKNINLAFDQSVRTPGRESKNLESQIEGLSSEWEQLLADHPELKSQAPWAYGLIVFQNRALKQAQKHLQTGNKVYEELLVREGEAASRRWLFKYSIQAKQEMVESLRRHLQWVRNPENYPDRRFSGTAFSVRSVASAFRELFSLRLQLDFDQQQRYSSEVSGPAAQLLSEYLQWLNQISPDHAAFFHSWVFSYLPISPEAKAIYLELSKKDNWSLWSSTLKTQPADWVKQPLAGFEFMLKFASLYSLSAEGQSEQAPGLRRQDLWSILEPADRQKYHRVWENFFPSEMSEYLVSDPKDLNHRDFLQFLNKIVDSKKSFDEVAKRSGVSISKENSLVEQSIAKELDNLDSYWLKEVKHLVLLTSALFAGYLPPNSEAGDQPFSQSFEQAFAQHTNAESIIMTVVDSLVLRVHPTYRMFFERFLADFVRLVNDVEPLGEAEFEQLGLLFHFYGKLEIPSETVEQLAIVVYNSPKARSVDRQLAAKYLLHVNSSKYDYLGKACSHLLFKGGMGSNQD